MRVGIQGKLGRAKNHLRDEFREREREREDFRQETGSDSVNRGIPGRGLLFEFKAKLHFSGYFKKFRI